MNIMLYEIVIYYRTEGSKGEKEKVRNERRKREKGRETKNKGRYGERRLREHMCAHTNVSNCSLPDSCFYLCKIKTIIFVSFINIRKETPNTNHLLRMSYYRNLGRKQAPKNLYFITIFYCLWT